MSGCYGNSPEDRYFESRLFEWLDQQEQEEEEKEEYNYDDLYDDNDDDPEPDIYPGSPL